MVLSPQKQLQRVKCCLLYTSTVSKANTVDNPITVTPTAGTNSKDYAIGIDTTKLASKTDLTYRANNDTDANAQKVSLAKGLNFVNGDNTVATVAADGKVSYDLNAATKTKIEDVYKRQQLHLVVVQELQRLMRLLLVVVMETMLLIIQRKQRLLVRNQLRLGIMQKQKILMI